jgi:hypothetical protein
MALPRNNNGRSSNRAVLMPAAMIDFGEQEEFHVLSG